MWLLTWRNEWLRELKEIAAKNIEKSAVQGILERVKETEDVKRRNRGSKTEQNVSLGEQQFPQKSASAH